MHYSYQTKGICATQIDMDIEEGKVRNVKFYGGCDGNHKGIISLVDGMPLQEVIQKLDGITCGHKSSSCPDQLAKALAQYQAENKES